MDQWEYKPAHDLHLTPAEKLRSLKREPGLISHTAQYLWQMVTHTYLRTYHRLRVTGLQHMPQQAPFVMIANHSSHLDALVLANALPWRLRRRAFPIAAGDVFFETPAASWFSATMLNALPMWRKHCGPHAMQELRHRLLNDPAIFLLFPEGQRSRTGEMNRFKPGLGMLIAETPVPVLPCFLSGAFAAYPPGARFPRPRTLQLDIGPALQFADVAHHRAGWEEITTRLETAVHNLRDAAQPPVPAPVEIRNPGTIDNSA